MRVEIINTGTELLLGRVVNTHPGFLGTVLLVMCTCDFELTKIKGKSLL